MRNLTIHRAVSEPGWPGRQYCLLENEASFRTYGCSETAQRLGAEKKAEQSAAYWHHFTTHVTAYTRWAQNRKLFDGTFQDAEEAVDHLVKEALLKFRKVVWQARFDPGRGPPCKYIRRTIKNLWQDIVRRGRRPSEADCRQCLETTGFCRFSGGEPSLRAQKQQCRRLPAFDNFEVVSRTFAEAGLQEGQTSPFEVSRSSTTLSRPVEEQVLQGLMVEQILTMAKQILSPVSIQVLIETYWQKRSSKEIAALLGRTPANVDQIRWRALDRLRRAIKE